MRTLRFSCPSLKDWVSRLEHVQETTKKTAFHQRRAPRSSSPSKEEYDTFLKEHPKGDFTPAASHLELPSRHGLASTLEAPPRNLSSWAMTESFWTSSTPPTRATLTVAKKPLITMRNRFRDAGVTFRYSRLRLYRIRRAFVLQGFSTEYHVVETVAHARAAFQYMPDITFLLDIGGQDMKAIWLTTGSSRTFL